MIYLRALLFEEESDAAQQAHKLGLTAGGWGTWKDASGKTVAKTIQGRLVKLEDVNDLDWDDEIDNFAQEIRTKYPGLRHFELMTNKHTGDLRLDTLVVDKSRQREGIGTKVMEDLVRFADAHNKRLTLTPAQKNKEHGTTSSSRLQKFYRRFGFVPNKGRKHDYRISDLMVREPNQRQNR